MGRGEHRDRHHHHRRQVAKGFMPQSLINNSVIATESDPSHLIQDLLWITAQSWMSCDQANHREHIRKYPSREMGKITETGIIPDLPCYELPAALMVPLIGPYRTEYNPLKPSDLRLPFPKFPDEQFIKTIDGF